MNIMGLGDNIIDTFLEKGFIKNIADIYTLTFEQVASLKKNGAKFAQNMIDSIENSKSNEFYRLINGLGIRNIGVKASKQLAKKFKNIDNLMNATVEELLEMDDMGEIMAKSLVDFFAQDQTHDLINKFKSYGINMVYQEETGSDNRFEGMTFVLTGALDKYTRKDAEDIIEKFGGKTSSSVSKKTTYVLSGEDSGSKLEKAKELGVTIISEKDFDDMIS